jgi:DNA polymerase II small subunit
MSGISRSPVREDFAANLDIVRRLAESGYQVDPEALELIRSYGGRKDDLIKRLLMGCDSSVAVISASRVSCLLKVPKDETAPASLYKLSQTVNDRSHIAPAADLASRSSVVQLNGDITGRSTCVGEYGDFVRYFRDRYSKLREIMARRLNSRPIESLSRSTAGREVSLIGMVMDVKSTNKGNRVLELEDPTGMVTAIIQKDSDIFEQSGLILPDEVIGVTGFSDGGGRVFVKSLMWPDLPNQCQALEMGSGYALLLSDLHAGSKYFEEDAWYRLVDWVNGGCDDPTGLASQVKYMVIAGDLVDGIGIYPGQDKDLAIMDVYEQYRKAAECLNAVRSGISIIISPGNHDMVRQAEPQPALPELVQKFFSGEQLFVGNPAWISLGGVSVLVYHGRSIDDLVMRIPGLSYGNPEKAMIEMLRRRHLSPIYGSRVSIAPEEEDHYVISKPPAILHCGHVHTVGIARYKGVTVINSGTWQSQTDFQKKMNIQPHVAVAPIVDLATMKVRKLIFS